MAEKNEEVKIFFTADVSGLEEGQKKVRTQFDGMLAKARGVTNQLDKVSDSGGLLGRTLQTVSDVAKGGAARLAALGGVAGTAVALTLRAARNEAIRSGDAIALLSSEAELAARRLTTLSKESDIGELAAQYEKARQNAAAFRKEAGERDQPWTLGGVFEGLSRFYNNLQDINPANPKAMGYGATNMLNDAKFQTAGAQATQDERKSQKMIADLYREKADLTSKLMAGQTDAVAIRQLEIAQQRELNELVIKTDENKAQVTRKYSAQIERIKQDRVTTVALAQGEVGVAKLLLRGDSERAELLKKSLKDQQEMRIAILSGADYENGQVQALQERQALEETMIKRQQAAAQREFLVAKAVQSIEATNLDSKKKALDITNLNLLAVRKQLGMAKELGITDEQKRALQLREGELTNQQRTQRQDAFFELRNRPGDRNALMAKQQREKTERDKFDALQERTGGMLNIHRDINGNPISGIDPFTGERGAIAQNAGPSLSDKLRATGVMGNTSVQGGSLSAGEAALSLSGDKAFLGSTKVKQEDKMQVLQQAQVQLLKDIFEDGVKIR